MIKLNSNTYKFTKIFSTIIFCLASMLFVNPSFSHNLLISTDPPANSKLLKLPATITLHFLENIKKEFLQVKLAGPVNNRNYLSKKPYADANNLILKTTESKDIGEYVVTYKLISQDGHPVSGQVHFFVTKTQTKDIKHQSY